MAGEKLFLASGSPRRRELIVHIHPAVIVPSGFEEPPLPPAVPSPASLVKHLASQKAVHAQVPGKGEGWVLGADTLVWLEGKALGKPKSKKEARAMLERLSGQEHRVYTGIAFVKVKKGVVGNQLHTAHAMTRVRFRELSDQDILRYLSTNEWTDKAGSYGAQGYGMGLLEEVKGCWTNVVGLPVRTTLKLWEEIGRI